MRLIKMSFVSVKPARTSIPHRDRAAAPHEVASEGGRQYDDLEKRLAEGPVIAVPTITLDGDSDGVAPASDGTSYAGKFSGKRTHRIIVGTGHNLPQEAPQAFAKAVVEVDGY